MSARTAAEATGQTVEAWRVRCREALARSGDAVLARLEDGRVAWFVRAELALGPISCGAEVGGLAGLRDSDIRKALRRKEALDRVAELARSEGHGRAVARMARERGVTAQTVRNWQKAFAAAGMAGIAPKWGRSGRRGGGPSAACAELVEQLTQFGNDIPLTDIFEVVARKAAERGLTRFRTVSAFRKWWRKMERPDRTLHGQNRTAFNQRYLPHLRIDYSKCQPLDIVQVDWTRAKAFVRAGNRLIRLWILNIKDAATGMRLVALTARTPNAEATLLGLRIAFKRYGVPRSLYFDNGKEFLNNLIHGRTRKQLRRSPRSQGQTDADAAGELLELIEPLKLVGVERVVLATPHSPWAKGIVEVDHKQANTRFCRGFVSFCGRANRSKPDLLADIGRIEAKLQNGETLTRLDADVWAAVPTEERFAEALEADRRRYNGRPTRRLGGRSPDQAWAANPPNRPVMDERALDHLLFARPAMVTGNGVQRRFAGANMSWGQGNAILRQWIGRRVLVSVDPGDIDHAVIFEPLPGGDRRFLTLAEADQPLPSGASAEEKRLAIRKIKIVRREYTRGKAAETRLHLDVCAIIQEHRAATAPAVEVVATGTYAADRPPIRVKRTGFEASLKDVQRALDARQSRARMAIDLESVTELLRQGSAKPATPDDELSIGNLAWQTKRK